MTAGAEFTPGQRGADYRLDDAPPRPSAADRLAARKARRRRPADEVETGVGAPSDVDDLETDGY